MNKLLKSIFLITIFLGFLVEIVNAQGFSPFYVKFTDANDNGSIYFKLDAENTDDQITYYTGVAPIDDHDNYTQLLAIPPNTKKIKEDFTWSVTPGGSKVYDIYLTLDNNTFYWTSQGYAEVENKGKKIKIYWKNFHVIETLKPKGKDNIQLTAVPIPSALWLLGSGVITLGLIRKKLLTC